MARNLRPKCKTCRRIGESVCGTAKCAIVKRNYPPGQSGVRNPRRRLTEYGTQLQEKQKAKFMYGVLEKQFRNYYKAANNKPGNTGDLLLESLETRLDNAVYRAGFATTRRQARQLVSHGLFTVNGKRCDVPSLQVSVNDRIELRAKSKASPLFVEMAGYLKTYESPKWLEVDQANFAFTIKSTPSKEDFEQNIAVHLIVEYYSR